MEYYSISQVSIIQVNVLSIRHTVLLRSLLVFNYFREDEFNGKCVLWPVKWFIVSTAIEFKVHNHQLCIRHQDWKMVEP